MAAAIDRGLNELIRSIDVLRFCPDAPPTGSGGPSIFELGFGVRIIDPLRALGSNPNGTLLDTIPNNPAFLVSRVDRGRDFLRPNKLEMEVCDAKEPRRERDCNAFLISSARNA